MQKYVYKPNYFTLYRCNKINKRITKALREINVLSSVQWAKTATIIDFEVNEGVIKRFLTGGVCIYCLVPAKHMGKALKLVFKKVIWIYRIDKIKCNWKENNGRKVKWDSK